MACVIVLYFITLKVKYNAYSIQGGMTYIYEHPLSIIDTVANCVFIRYHHYKGSPKYAINKGSATESK